MGGRERESEAADERSFIFSFKCSNLFKNLKAKGKANQPNLCKTLNVKGSKLWKENPAWNRKKATKTINRRTILLTILNRVVVPQLRSRKSPLVGRVAYVIRVAQQKQKQNKTQMYSGKTRANLAGVSSSWSSSWSYTHLSSRSCIVLSREPCVARRVIILVGINKPSQER